MPPLDRPSSIIRVRSLLGTLSRQVMLQNRYHPLTQYALASPHSSSVLEVQTVDTTHGKKAFRCDKSAKCCLTDAESAGHIWGLASFEIPQFPKISRADTFKSFTAGITAVVDLCSHCQLPPQRLRIAIMMTNLRSNRNKAHLGLGALLIALCFISWLVLLGGIAAVQKLGE